MAQAPTAVPVLTWRYDLTHAGQNTRETALTPANVASNAFGKLFSLTVDDHVFAQPLYVPNLKMSDGQVHNVLFVATENDSIYAFDADATGSPIWQVSMLTAAHGAGPGATPVPENKYTNGEDIGPNIGITGTPAINPATNTMYVVANTEESGQYFSRLHAINIITGAEQSGSPVKITATVAGTAGGSSNGQVTFSAFQENQRAALNYYNGYVYIAYGSHGDIAPWEGWVFAYNAATLQQTAAMCLSPDDNGGSVWGSGAGLPIDTNVSGGRMFVVTGNGNRTTPFQANSDYGESVVAFNLANGQLSPTDEWTAFNWQALNSAPDWDQGSGGVLMLPDQPGANPHLIITAGKEGRITVLSRDKLGGLAPSGSTSNTNAVQDITLSQIQQGQGFWSTAAYWNGNVYVWAGGDNGGTPNAGMMFKMNNGVVDTKPDSETTVTSAFPGPTFSISSNGTQNGIAWAVKADQFNSEGPAVLYAFDPDDLANTLYESDTKSSDSAGRANKFSVPVVTNGKVYVAAYREVDIYGLLDAQSTTAAPVITPGGGTYSTAQSVTLSDTDANAAIYYTTDGSTPSVSSNHYTAPIQVAASETIKAIAIDPAMQNSNVTSAAYVIQTGSSNPPFSMSGSSITLSAGGSGTSTITIMPSGGFTGTVALACGITASPANAVNLPTCSVSQAPAITNSQAVTAQLTINTTAAQQSASLRDSKAALGGAFTLAALFALFLPRRRRTRQALLGLLVLAGLVAGAAGCSITTGKINTIGAGTTKGTYTVTVTGTNGTIKETAAVSVTIQ
ncbi:MAG TPA: chitobiase/beta-hexosaminidase C-terminal domain-containing protein [Terracidiphilus sp.]|nr:chitobiase/beta-hexosaminidase C-terminal domain-containing protein [Terracidiphilus sp.]